MTQFLNKHKQGITCTVLFAFVLSWFSLIGQASAHTFMMLETQQQMALHKKMGHEVSAHCKPVLCASVISLDDQSGHGLDHLQLINLASLPVAVSYQLPAVAPLMVRTDQLRWSNDYGPPPLQLSGILRI